jgi:hypothetical protein
MGVSLSKYLRYNALKITGWFNHKGWYYERKDPTWISCFSNYLWLLFLSSKSGTGTRSRNPN